MRGAGMVMLGVLAAATVSPTPAGAQLPIGTFAGRQIGDGRAATAASLDRPFGVAFAADGALLIADRRHHRIRRVDPTTGVITTIAGSIAGSRGGVAGDQGELKGPLRVRVEANGDLLIADFDNHMVRRLVAATGLLVRLAGAPDTPGDTGDGGLATSALLSNPADASPDGAGGILIADRANHRIRRIDGTGVITTVAGTGTPGYSGDGVPGGAAAAELNLPACVLPIPPGDGGGFFVCDEGNHAIRRVDGTGTITTVAGTGTPGFLDGPAASAAFDGPINLARDADGSLLVADEANNRIRRIDLTAGTVTTVAGTGPNAFTPDGEPAAGSPLAGPTSVTLASDGRIVFAEDESHRVRAIDASGNLVTLAGDGVSTFGGDGGPAVDAQLGQTKSVAPAGDGRRFIVADDGNARVRRVDACTGVIETIAGNGSRVYGGDGGPALEAGLTVSDALEDAAGNLLIADTDNNRIRIVDAAGTIGTLAGTGDAGFTGDGGPATIATLSHPTGLALGPDGSLYIADFDNHAVRRVSNGVITTVAGTGVPGFNGDDIPAATATVTNPTDVEVDPDGNVFIADFGNHRIRRIDAATGLIATVAGSGVAGDEGDGGPATAARLNQPSDVKLDATGALWVADFANHRIRRLTVGGTIETVAGTGLRGYAGDGGPAAAARLLFPLRLLVLAPDQVLVAERDNFVVRSLGTVTVDCEEPPPPAPENCTGEGAATCVPGGGPARTDCFAEFRFAHALGAGVPSPRVRCVDDDPTCDADTTAGQCTFRVGVCLNNEDTRLACTPGAITAVRFRGKLAKSPGGQDTAAAVGGFAPSRAFGGGRNLGVAFLSAYQERNGCTALREFVVRRGRKKGTGKLATVVKTAGAEKDRDKLRLVCLAP